MLWLIVGLILGIVLAYLVGASRSGSVSVRWYQWLLGALAVALYLLAIQNYLALQDELEPALATFTLLAFGLPALVATALVWAIPAIAQRAARKEVRARTRTA